MANTEECTHDCSTCGANCPSKNKESMIEACNKYSNVKHVIGIVSGKGGVGKSLVTSMLAVLTNRLGHSTAIIDADVTGPSIPRIFGVRPGVDGTDDGLIPPQSENGIKIMSVNLLLDSETTPVVWRGPVIAGVIKQFWTDVIWDDVEYMYVDIPPGTGDVPLTVFQSLPLDGIIIVTSPQELVSMIVEKAVNMASLMNIPVLGIVENMSWLECPDCKKRIELFGKSHVEEIAKEHNLKILAKIPIDPELAKLCDSGKIEGVGVNYLDDAVNEIVK
ncbi:MAG: Mrp/NBP35 family ATP-binding protein [Firmicutes bacterium]|nr:Mrp/NBP35 family ATP-binding protein [Bacillota bacterium]